MFLLLHQNPQFRQLKYQYLYQLVENYDQLTAQFQDIYHQNANSYLYDTTDEISVLTKKKLFLAYLNTINHNQALIKRQLEFTQLAINIINHPSSINIEVIPDSVVPIKITKFELQFKNRQPVDITQKFDQSLIMAEYSHDYDLLPTTFTFQVPIQAILTGVNIKAKNQITKQAITSIHSAIARP